MVRATEIFAWGSLLRVLRCLTPQTVQLWYLQCALAASGQNLKAIIAEPFSSSALPSCSSVVEMNQNCRQGVNRQVWMKACAAKPSFGEARGHCRDISLYETNERV